MNSKMAEIITKSQEEIEKVIPRAALEAASKIQEIGLQTLMENKI